MKKKTKRILSAVLSMLLLLSVFVPAFAATPTVTGSKVPVVVIGGDGDTLVDKDGKALPKWFNAFGNISEKGNDAEGSKEIYKSVANVLLPFLIDGLLTGNYDRYYENLQKEIAEVFADSLLDENGEASNGSGISQSRKNTMAYNVTRDSKNGKGYYGFYDYQFYYDWRLDPLETADRLNEYIQAIKKVTGAPKVAIVARCLGSVIAMAYVAKYGTDDLHGLSLDGAVANGAEILSEPISGKFVLDGNAISRYLMDMKAVGQMDVDSLIVETVELVERAGILGTVSDVTKETIYYVVVKGVTSALALSTFCTWPSFWSIVKEEDFDTAMEYVFGPEGGEKRVTYAKLIEKINNYDALVRNHIPELMNEVNDNANLAIFSKYGLQLNPVAESRNRIADQFVTVERSSYGATTTDIYSSFSDEYVAERISEGKGKYIAPDRQVDASTCMFPDQTWFIKGAEHGDWIDIESEVLYTVATADRQLTVDDLDCSQFSVYSYETDKVDDMTEENCDTYYWKADKNSDHPDSSALRLLTFLTSFFKWLKSIFDRFIIKK